MKVLVLLVGALVVGSLLNADPLLRIQAPRVILAPGRLVVQTIVEPDVANRAIQVIAESADWYRSSEIQLDGKAAPRRHAFEFKDVPSDSYEIRVILFGANEEQRALAVQKLEVVAHVK
jgi:hypothetical protein